MFNIFKNNKTDTNTQESKIMIEEYIKNSINNHKMKDPTVEQHEGNFICGDDITVYLKIENNKILEYSFDGNCSSITKASASFLSEIITGKNIDEIFNMNYQTLYDLGFIVSNRRRRASVIAIQACQNAIYKYKKNNNRVELEDLI